MFSIDQINLQVVLNYETFDYKNSTILYLLLSIWQRDTVQISWQL